MSKTIRISARRDGFRRAGMSHAKGPVDHPAGTFTPAQLAALKTEPQLHVEEIDGGDGGDGEAGENETGKGKAGKGKAGRS